MQMHNKDERNAILDGARFTIGSCRLQLAQSDCSIYETKPRKARTPTLLFATDAIVCPQLAKTEQLAWGMITCSSEFKQQPEEGIRTLVTSSKVCCV